MQQLHRIQRNPILLSIVKKKKSVWEFTFISFLKHLGTAISFGEANAVCITHFFKNGKLWQPSGLDFPSPRGENLRSGKV